MESISTVAHVTSVYALGLFQKLSWGAVTLSWSSGWGTFALKFVLWVMGVEQKSVLGMRGHAGNPQDILKLHWVVLWVEIFLINYVLGMGA